MLRLIEPDEVPPEPAYRVPWTIDRTSLECSLRNDGDETLRRVIVFALGTGRLLLPGAHLIAPGEHITLAEGRIDRVDDTVAVVRWNRPDDAEYLWRFSL